MEYEIRSTSAKAVDIDGEGEITIITNEGYRNEEWRAFSIEEMEAIVNEAKAYKANYEAFIANDSIDV